MNMKLNPIMRASLFAAPLLLPGTALAASDTLSGDALITDRVKTALAEDRRLQVKAPIEVHTRDGVVSLSGDVRTPAMVYRAVEKTRQIDGVRDVETHHLEAR